MKRIKVSPADTRARAKSETREEVERLRAKVAAYEKGRDISGYLGGKAIEDYEKQNGELVRFRAELKEANEAIHELQQEACDRAGVPMPSQRPLVERLRAANAELAVKAANEIARVGIDAERLRAEVAKWEERFCDAVIEIKNLHAEKAELRAALEALLSATGRHAYRAAEDKARAAIAKAKETT
jgi:chromosome segregation ATPase